MIRILELSKNVHPGGYNFGKKILFLSILAIIALGACTLDESANPVPVGDTETVQGLIQNVESKTLLGLDVIEIADEEGLVWRVEGRGLLIPEFTPSHLNEHKVLGLKINVTFYREGDVLVLTDITD